MIIVKLMGGLGNQMFQYAAARGLADRHKTEVVLDLSWFRQDFDETITPRKYELNCFTLDSKTRKLSGSVKVKLMLKLATKYREPHHHYDPLFQKLPKNCELLGYFQCEEYFKDSRSNLLDDFTWTSPPSHKNAIVLEQILQDSKSVSVHVRRGDYISNITAAKYHGTANVDYYYAAIEKISKQEKRPNLYIFSDEPDWCKKNLKFTQPTEYISHNENGSEDMRLMVACRHNIIANSSFSWWGAWLNQNEHKMVIAPKQWFLHGESNAKDVIPKSWQKI